MIRAGILEFNCGECDSNTKGQLGCETATTEPVWEDEEDAFYHCPFGFLSHATIDFLSRHDALKNGWATGLPYDQTLNRFLEAIKIFEAYQSKFESEKDKEPTNDFSAFQQRAGNNDRPRKSRRNDK